MEVRHWDPIYLDSSEVGTAFYKVQKDTSKYPIMVTYCGKTCYLSLAWTLPLMHIQWVQTATEELLEQRESKRAEAAAALERRMAAMEAAMAARRTPIAEAKPEAARGPGADLRFQARHFKYLSVIIGQLPLMGCHNQQESVFQGASAKRVWKRRESNIQA